MLPSPALHVVMLVMIQYDLNMLSSKNVPTFTVYNPEQAVVKTRSIIIQ